jgi:hypothetical protein
MHWYTCSLFDASTMPNLQTLFVQLHFDFLHGLMASVMTWCTSWMVHLVAFLSLYSPESIDWRMFSNSEEILAMSLE